MFACAGLNAQTKMATMASLCRLRPVLTRTLRPTLGASLHNHVPGAVIHSFSSASNAQNPQKQQQQQQLVSTILHMDIPTTTAGKVLDYLNTQCKNDLTNAHIQALVNACESPTDFPKVLHAIATFKRTRGYVMDAPTADGTISRVLTCSPTADGALWVLENFKERTGLYYSATTYALDRALDVLWKDLPKQHSDWNDITKERVWRALREVSFKLIQRKTLRGARGLKKRAKKQYLKCLQTKGGPTQHTVRRVVEISVWTKRNPEETRTTFIVPFQTANVSIHPKTLEWLEQQKENQQSGNEEEESNTTVDEKDAPSEDQAEKEDSDEKENKE